MSGSSFFISLTTSAFYLGETLQHITASQVLAIFKNAALKSAFPNISVNALASTRSPLL